MSTQKRQHPKDRKVQTTPNKPMPKFNHQVEEWVHGKISYDELRKNYQQENESKLEDILEKIANW